MQETPVRFLGQEVPLEKGKATHSSILGLQFICSVVSDSLTPWAAAHQASLVAQLVKNPPAVQENWLRSLGWEDPLGKGKATHSSILA